MLEFIRTHRRLMQFMLLLIILPSFAFVGLESYTRMGGGADTLAKVGGQNVSQQEFDAAQRQQMERFRQMFGEQFDAKMFDTPEARQAVLDNLIAQKALAAEATRKHLTVSDATLQQAILSIPDLVGPDGKFDSERYKSLLAVQGMNPSMYEARLRQDLALQTINGAIQNSAFAPKSLAARLSDIGEQEREVQELNFKAADYVAQVKITDQMLKDYYDKSAGRFDIPEQATAEYVVLNADAIAAQTTVSDADIKSYYDQNARRYSIDEQRRASHILITAAKDAPAADKTAAKAKADSLLAQLRKNPADFARLAKENSQDPGSAERGGDLDFFGKGMMVKPFEDAAYRLGKGQISDVVQSDFGYHIIQVTDIKPAAVKTLAEVKDEIGAEIKKQLAAKKYTEMAEQFSNLVYEQADTLKPAVDKLGLKIERASNLTRTPNPAMAPNAPVNNPKFLAALFTDDVLKNKHNTEAIEVAPSTLVAGRIVDYKPATKRPFEEVRAQVREQVAQAEALNLAKQAGLAKLAELKAKPDHTGFAAAKMISRKKSDLPGEVTLAALKADATKLPAFVGTELPGQGYTVIRINKLAAPAAPDAARRQAEQQQVANVIAQQETLAYIDMLKKKAKTEIVKPLASVAPAEQPNR
ncbi:MAG: peptidylprolyl isomerase [Herminiimonas sp.]|nr:peptidylprolyl isomerase [Herminiimonas sp.]